jgi:hypothetical protein
MVLAISLSSFVRNAFFAALACPVVYARQLIAAAGISSNRAQRYQPGSRGDGCGDATSAGVLLSVD